jgi:hypothetical protein
MTHPFLVSICYIYHEVVVLLVVGPLPVSVVFVETAPLLVMDPPPS